LAYSLFAGLMIKKCGYKLPVEKINICQLSDKRQSTQQLK